MSSFSILVSIALLVVCGAFISAYAEESLDPSSTFSQRASAGLGAAVLSLLSTTTIVLLIVGIGVLTFRG